MTRKVLFVFFLLYVFLCSLSQGVSEEGQAPQIFSRNDGSTQKGNGAAGTTPSSISINANFPDDYGDINVKKSSNIIDPFNDLSIKYLEDANSTNVNDSKKENYSVDYKSNTIIIKINRLKAKHCIRYNFNITSDKTGVFPATTLVRIAGDTSKLSDINIPFDIEVRPPTFEAHLEKSSAQIIAGDRLNITYNIIHKSGWCTDPFRLSVTLKNSTNNEYVLYRNGKIYNEGERIDTSFSTLKYSPINAIVSYKNGGKQLLPEVLVEGQVIPIPYEEREIQVYEAQINKYMEEYNPTYSTYGLIIALIFSIIAIILSFFDVRTGKTEINIMNRQLHIMGEELKIMKKDSDSRNHQNIRNCLYNNSASYDNEYVDEEGVPRGQPLDSCIQSKP